MCVLLVKTALFASIAASDARWKTALFMPLAVARAGGDHGRVYLCSFRGGLGTIFVPAGARRWLLLVWAPVVLLAAGWLLAGVEGLVMAAASLGVGLGIGFYCQRRIRGYTGDTLGATNEIVECIPALVGTLWAWN